MKIPVKKDNPAKVSHPFPFRDIDMKKELPALKKSFIAGHLLEIAG